MHNLSLRQHETPHRSMTGHPVRAWLLVILLAPLLVVAAVSPCLAAGSPAAADGQSPVGQTAEISSQTGLWEPEYMAKPVAARVAAGLLHSAMISYDGQLYVWGDNTYGQLGLAGVDYSDSPQPVKLPARAAAVSLGAYHTLVVLDDGSVYAFGRNAFGQLGNGTTANALQPVQVTGLPAIVDVAAGSYHSLALAKDGSVWAWGNNSDGEVGDVAAEEIIDAGGKSIGSRCTLPVQIIGSGAVAIAAGGYHSLYLDKAGLVYAWGDNSLGQLGDGTTQSHAQPGQVPGLSSVSAIAAGYQHNLALCRQAGRDALMAWGDDSLGQLGIGSSPAGKVTRTLPVRVDVTSDTNPDNDHIVAIQAGYAQSAAIVPLISGDGSVDVNRQRLLLWGSNSSGQLATDRADTVSRPRPVIASSNGWTGDSFLPFDGVALGGWHSLVLSSKGLLAAAGRGDMGQLGNLSVLDRSQFGAIDLPDPIRPAWLATSQVSLAFDLEQNLVVRWPAAQDNRTVAGYRVRLACSDGQVTTFDAGKALVAVVSNALPGQAYEATVMAYDRDAAQAPDETLSRLVGYVLPDNAWPAAVPADYFPAARESIPNVANPANHWQPDSQGLVRPLEVPWDVSAIYGPSAIAPPGNWLVFLLAAIVAALILLIVFVHEVLWIRRHKISRHIRRRIRLISRPA
jgi:alpha-tubulin suppressor-like RCC1 family protein